MILNKPSNINGLGSKKTIKLLAIGDDKDSAINEYFMHLQDFAEISRHVYDITCKVVSKGDDGLKQIKEWDPSVIIVDAHLSDMNSFEILDACKKEHLPVVVTSDYRSAEIRESVENSGASAYVPKSDCPDDFEYLLQKIASLAEDSRIKH